MPFATFTPPPEPERHHALTNVRTANRAVVRAPITKASQLHSEPAAAPHADLYQYDCSTWQDVRRSVRNLPAWVWWLVAIAAFIAFWWVSMPFRGLMIVVGIFWFFAFGAHPMVHMGRTAHNLLDGDSNDNN